MKLLAIALLSAAGLAAVVSTREAFDARLQAHLEAVARGVDDDPPVDCPLCGGDAVQHLRTMRRMLRFQSQLILGASLAR